MIVDTSALLAVLFDEPDAILYARTIAEAPNCRMSVANFMEAAFVVEGRAGIAGGHDLDLFLETASIELEPITVEQARAARRTWRRFGKGNHPAGFFWCVTLNYALPFRLLHISN